ncbi:MAG: RagB/SusD family nutrient uptake outer membrane protein [Chitinophagaceae bacterium]
MMQIRKYTRWALAAMLVVALAASCKRVETEPRDWIKDDLVWDEMDQNAALAGWFLNDVYNYIPTGFNRIGGDFLDAASGDAVPSRNNTSIENYTNGRISVLNNPDPYWSNSYFGIRRANIFLANIDRVPAAANLIVWWKAEARFIRALLYFEMLKRYGGIPLIGDTVFSLNDDLQIPRNTFAECVDYIASECDAIKTDLRNENSGADYGEGVWGRIPRGAPLALKCRLFLYAASPLFNGGGIASDPTKRALMGYPDNDPTRWQKVIDAANELNALGYYSLNASFAGLFTTKRPREVILAKQQPNNFTIEAQNAPVGFRPNNVGSEGRTSPTQQLVDAFLMNNGKMINEAGSTYNPDSPYARRDARLAATVFFNGMRWLSRNVQTYEGGLDKPNNPTTTRVQTKTGYYLKKYMADFSNNTVYSNQSHNFILFRYAEILLNMAEAMNELGRTEDAVTRIIEIRKRAGIAAGSDSRYGIKAAITQDEMRELIRNERRIELAFEEHRFWDIRRWKIASTVLNQPAQGMRITLGNGNVLSYERFNAVPSAFQDRLYLMPLPYDETIKNLALIQNEGW